MIDPLIKTMVDPLMRVLQWMRDYNKIADCESIGYDPEFKTFPLDYHGFVDLWEQVLVDAGVEDRYVDQGWTKNDPEASWIQESRYFFEYEGFKFIVRWLRGQGDAHQIILSGQWDEMVPFDESRKVVLNRG